MPDVPLLTVVEVAALMRVSRMTVYRLVRTGALPAVHVGRGLRVPEPAVHQHLRQSLDGGPDAAGDGSPGAPAASRPGSGGGPRPGHG